jgi:enamine deaminase RidA (YjgF/YER057c/UK114 family)
MIEHIQAPGGNPGSYSRGVRKEDLIFTCGQLGVAAGDLKPARTTVQFAAFAPLILVGVDVIALRAPSPARA